MSETSIDEALKIVADAQSKGKFRLEDVIKGKGNPEDIVDVYTDSSAAYELSKISDLIDSTLDEKEEEELKAEAEPLKEKVLKSRLRFFMRGIDQGLVEAIEKQARERTKDEEDADRWVIYYFCGLIAANVYKVEDIDGNVDDRVFSMDDAIKWRESFPTEAWNVLIEAMQKLTLATGYFRGLTDAGFLQKS